MKGLLAESQFVVNYELARTLQSPSRLVEISIRISVFPTHLCCHFNYFHCSKETNAMNSYVQSFHRSALQRLKATSESSLVAHNLLREADTR